MAPILPGWAGESAEAWPDRRQRGLPEGACVGRQLPYDLEEFTFRFERRDSRTRGLLFYRLLHQAVATEPHPLNALTLSEN